MRTARTRFPILVPAIGPTFKDLKMPISSASMRPYGSGLLFLDSSMLAIDARGITLRDDLGGEGEG